MPFTKPLPHWEAPGIEPPTSLRENGWKAGIKPPDEYFNYLQNKAYEALKELQEYAVHKDEMDLSGVATKEDLKVVKEGLTTHLADKTNPHGVTKSQVGLSDVQNYGVATVAEAKAGTVNNKYMTPLRLAEAIPSLVPKNEPNGYMGLGPDGKPLPSMIPGAIETITEIDFSTNPAASVKTEGLENYRYLEVFCMDIEHNHTNTAIISFSFGELTYNDFMVTLITGSSLYNGQINSDYRLGFNNIANGGKGLIKCFIDNSEHLNTQGFTMAYTSSTNTSPGFTQTVARPSRYRLPSLTLTIGNGQMVGGKFIIKGVRK
ncbi:hypothetical protein H9650_11300 [Psychrobacillus sp. Sa2BUA9]|uniref:Tail fiber protein n=1 Tax=Psychrobacillus faecigallinarum TaxID=2762235 RepID=A0ABR8RA74_9BACI|nr:hypothetical protein [Psychrobacillus faecigallinarum]MBD7944701.1 hypothetical protein [Psychrobacillus faecigallinarum]